MGEIRDIRSVARPIEFGNRKEKLEKRTNEILQKKDELRKKYKDLKENLLKEK